MVKVISPRAIYPDVGNIIKAYISYFVWGKVCYTCYIGMNICNLITKYQVNCVEHEIYAKCKNII